MKRSEVIIVALGALLACSASAQAVLIDWVIVGDAGNAADTEVMGDKTTGYGSVSYVYWIGKYEVTNSQYCEFLNAVAAVDTYELYNPDMAGGVWDSGGIVRADSRWGYRYSVKAGRGNNPVNYVSWYDAQRFANWLHNGQPVGPQDATTTEDGAYTFSGATSVGPRNPEAKVFLPNEDEWYKAAYYKAGSTDAGYWDYATQSDTQPSLDAPPGGNNSANAGTAPAGGHGLTDVGAYVNSVSAYGTYDQNGNVAEWIETRTDFSWCYLRGGSWDVNPIAMAARLRDNAGMANNHSWHSGFRVAMVPEPAAVLLFGLGGLGLVRSRKLGCGGNCGA